MHRNPIPVVVGIVFIGERNLLAIRRAIPPFVGEVALPSGYVEEGDHWRDRLQKEIEEEACVVVSTDPKHMRLYEGRTTPDGKTLLLFAVVQREGVKEVKDFVPNEEVSERLFPAFDQDVTPNLCFPLHVDVLQQFRKEYWQDNWSVKT